MTSKLLILFTCFIFNGHPVGEMHKYYSSITEIEFDTEEKLAKIDIQLFSDDLLKLFEDRFLESPDDFNHLNTKQETLFKEYLSKKILLTLNRKPTKLYYLGMEEENNLVHVYLEAKTHRKPMRVGITNSILQDIFFKQTNIVHIRHKKITKSVHLTYEKNSAIVFFDNTAKFK